MKKKNSFIFPNLKQHHILKLEHDLPFVKLPDKIPLVKLKDDLTLSILMLKQKGLVLAHECLEYKTTKLPIAVVYKCEGEKTSFESKQYRLMAVKLVMTGF
jgi:hypothetical protein